jgi:hypothetical protein
LELQRDRERLRATVRPQRISAPVIDYDVALDQKNRQLEINYTINEGKPVVVRKHRP